MNVGIAGASSYIQMEPLGNVWVSSTTGTSGVTVFAVNTATLKGMATAKVESPVMTEIKSDALVTVEASAIQVGGKSEPALLGKAFADLFKEHQHPSSVGPTGPIMPQYAAKIIKTMSKKVFLG